ncbi:hypothetical protein HYX04_02550 [Candidatus Woesearchaeota archaeon]|nr:hypothetical protein [Candidatus Woesearchaeota archaeon]
MKEININENQVWIGIIAGVFAGMILIIADVIGSFFPKIVGLIIKLLLAVTILLILIVIYLTPRSKK